jgi:hypothetical protein
MSAIRQITVPVSQIRLILAVGSSFLFGAFLIFASLRFQWFTPITGALIPFGIAGGLLLGRLETQIVTRRLEEDTQTVVWQMLVVSSLLFGVPLLLGKVFLDNAAFLPLAGFFFLPSVPVFCAVSGWRYRAFERQNSVQIKMLSFGYLYYKEPMVVDNNRLHFFLRQVASKDHAGLWQYTGYCGRLITALKQREDIELSTKEKLFKVLDVMNKYRWVGLTILLIFLAFSFGMLSLFAGNNLGLTQILNTNTLNIIMPIFLGVFIGFCASVATMMWTFNRKISAMIAKIDSGKIPEN